MHKILGIYCFVLLLIFCSCGREKGQQEPSVEIRDGIEYIINRAEPLHPETNVQFEEDLSISGEDDEGNIILYSPYSYAVDEAGSIYIFDRMDPAVKKFDTEGQLIRTIGGKGQGPGEFQFVSSMAYVPVQRLLTLDYDQNRISLFTDEGSFISSHNFQNSSFGIYFAADSFFAREETTVLPGTTPMTWRSALSAKAFDYQGQELFSYGEFQARQSGFVNEEGRQFSFSRPYEVLSVLAGDPENARLYHCLNDQYSIDVYNREGRLFRKIERPHKRIPVNENDKKSYLDGFRDRGSTEQDVRLIEKNANIPDFKPVTNRMLVDSLGRLWVELNETVETVAGTYWIYDIFDKDGFYVYRFQCEYRPGQIRDGKMYRMDRDEESGELVFKRYRITTRNKREE